MVNQAAAFPRKFDPERVSKTSAHVADYYTAMTQPTSVAQATLTEAQAAFCLNCVKSLPPGSILLLIMRPASTR